MVWGPTNRPDANNRPGQDNNTNRDTDGPQTPVAPPSPGGGGLTNPHFSGDHVLESVAQGNGSLKRGARGPAVRALQKYLISQGFDLGPAGADGSWGAKTTSAVSSWQNAHGLSADGVVGKNTLAAMDKDTSTAPPAATTTPSGGAPAANEPGGGLPTDFEKMWDAHPHNYQRDGSQNTASSDLQEQQGWDPDQYSNTCAIRLSVMFNKLGGNFKLDRQKAKAAGIDPARLPYSRKTGWYYILSAKEMWTYVSYWGGQPHQEFPDRGRYKDSYKFEEDFNARISDVVKSKKGIVAFDKIFGYSGTGHVDIFNGLQLSDASDWYPSQALKLWFI